MRPWSMNFRKMIPLLWIVISTTFLLNAACFGAVQPLVQHSEYQSSILPKRLAPGRCDAVHSSRKPVSSHSDLRRSSPSIITIAHRRVHRRFGIESPAAPVDPFFLRVSQLFDASLQVRSSARVHSNGRSPPNPSI